MEGSANEEALLLNALLAAAASPGSRDRASVPLVLI